MAFPLVAVPRQEFDQTSIRTNCPIGYLLPSSFSTSSVTSFHFLSTSRQLLAPDCRIVVIKNEKNADNRHIYRFHPTPISLTSTKTPTPSASTPTAPAPNPPPKTQIPAPSKTVTSRETKYLPLNQQPEKLHPSNPLPAVLA